MMEGYLIDIRGYEDPLTESCLLQQTDEIRQEKIRRLRRPDDRKRSLIAGLLIRHFLNRAGMTEEDLRYTPSGKPLAPGLHFNVSHGGNYVLAVLSETTEVGCDIEAVSVRDEAMMEYYYSTGEQRYVREHENPDRGFYEIWTKKESYIKCLGESLDRISGIDVFKTEICFFSDFYDGHVISIAAKEEIEMGAWNTRIEPVVF